MAYDRLSQIFNMGKLRATDSRSIHNIRHSAMHWSQNSRLKTQVMEACILASRPRLHGTPMTLENVHPMQLHCSHQKREKLLCITIGRCLNLRQRPCYVVVYEICALLACLGQLLSQPTLTIIKEPAYHKSRMRRENIVPIPQSMQCSEVNAVGTH